MAYDTKRSIAVIVLLCVCVCVCLELFRVVKIQANKTTKHTYDIFGWNFDCKFKIISNDFYYARVVLVFESPHSDSMQNGSMVCVHLYAKLPATSWNHTIAWFIFMWFHFASVHYTSRARHEILAIFRFTLKTDIHTINNSKLGMFFVAGIQFANEKKPTTPSWAAHLLFRMLVRVIQCMHRSRMNRIET